MFAFLADAPVQVVEYPGYAVGWGTLADGRSFILTEDLAGYRPADKLVESGTPFDQLLEPTADLTAQLHRASLHLLGTASHDWPVRTRRSPVTRRHSPWRAAHGLC